jgi:hypothetical protein
VEKNENAKKSRRISERKSSEETDTRKSSVGLRLSGKAADNFRRKPRKLSVKPPESLLTREIYYVITDSLPGGYKNSFPETA